MPTWNQVHVKSSKPIKRSLTHLNLVTLSVIKMPQNIFVHEVSLPIYRTSLEDHATFNFIQLFFNLTLTCCIVCYHKFVYKLMSCHQILRWSGGKISGCWPTSRLLKAGILGIVLWLPWWTVIGSQVQISASAEISLKISAPLLSP